MRPPSALVDGRYAVERVLGRGGQGVVFLARDRAAGDAPVALKVFQDALSGPAAELFQAEVRALARIAHPAVPPALDVGLIRKVEGRPPDAALRPGARFLARAYVEGEDLLGASRGRPWAEVRPLVLALARALDDLHARGLCHGDLKPANVLVPRRPAPGEPAVRLIDLGPGATIDYLAPERIRGAPPDRKADLYALGATLYRVLAGAPVFASESAALVARGHMEEAPRPLAGRTDAPAAVMAAVLRLLEKVPARRFPSARAFLRAIGEAEAARAEEEGAEGLALSLRAAPLAGREAEVALLDAALLAARPERSSKGGKGTGPGPRQRALLLEGGRGAGKSRLLREAALRARLQGFAVIEGGDLAVAAPPPPSAPAAPDEAARLANLDARAGALLARAAREGPLALVLDDIDLAGEEERALVSILARRLPRARRGLALIAAARPGALPDLAATRVPLADLAPPAIPALIRGALGPLSRGGEALAAHLERTAGGNPALIEASLAALARAGALRIGAAGALFDDQATARPALAAPGGPSAPEPSAAASPPAATSEHAPERRAALALATLGRPVPLGLLAAAAGLSVEEALAAFRALALAGRALETGGRLALAPAAAPLEGFLEAERAAAARRAADAILAAPEKDEAEAGRLLVQAGAPSEAAPHLLAAARAALLARRVETARALFADALAAAPPAESAIRAGALLGAGEAALLAGAGAEAAARLQEALPLVPGSARAGALLLLAEAEAKRGDPAAALARIAEARAEKGCDIARAFEREGAIHLGRGDLAEAEAALTRALDAALDAPARRAAIKGEIAGVRFRRGHAKEALALLEEAAALAGGEGDLRAQALFAMRLGTAIEAIGGRRDEARGHLERAARLFGEAKDRAGRANALVNLGNLLRNQGDHAAALPLLARAARYKRELGVLSGLAIALVNLAHSQAALGRTEAALRTFRRAKRAARKAGEQGGALAADCGKVEVLISLGRLTEALGVARSMHRREKARAYVYGAARSRWAIGAVLLARGDLAGAARAFRAAERHLHKVGHPLDLERVHALLSETYRRIAGLPEREGPGAEEAQALRARVRALEGESSRGARLAASAAALADEAELRPLLERICDDAVALLGAERAFVVLRREGGGLDFAATKNLAGEAVLRPEAKAPRALLEAVLRGGAAIASSDALKDRRLRDLTSVQVLDVRSVLAVPIRERGLVTGALYVDHRVRPGGFGEDAPRLLEAFAALAAVAVARARLRSALRERTDEAAALRASLEARGTEEDPAPATRTVLASPAPAGPFGAFAGGSAALREVLAAAARVARADLPVLILGDSGTGKELLARAIHMASPRRARPFVAESCAALPETLLESELFGHVRGAFTGADRDRAGLFQEAHGGTLFLDEVGDTSPGMQAKLLRALEEGEVRPVGATQARRVDVRILAATNKDPSALRAQGLFRDDLYFRLSAVTLVMPPLRARAEDILPIAERILERIPREGGRPLTLARAAAEALLSHGWPGNVRELQNVLQAAALFAERGRIGRAALEAAGFRSAPASARRETPRAQDAPGAPPSPPASYEEVRRELVTREKALLEAALAASGGNRLRTAEHLGMSRYAFLRLLKKLGIR